MTASTPGTALVTGASRGFGAALVRSLAADGWRLILDGRDPAALERIATVLGGACAAAIAGDVSDPAHRGALADAVEAEGRLDLLVNNASSLGPSPLPRLSEYGLTSLEEVYRVNVFAPLCIIQRSLPYVRVAAGTVVNISSDAAVEAYPGWGGYGSSKAALDQLSRVLATENETIRVYSFDPGDMRTDMHQLAFPGEDISDRPEPETVVPALRRLIAERPASGRYRAADNTDLIAGVR